MLLDNDNQEVGEVWFNGHTRVEIRACVVLGWDEKRWGQQEYQGY
jgi:hypothetical protein